jgi:hypothetical protein
MRVENVVLDVAGEGIARHVMRLCLIQNTRVQNVKVDVAACVRPWRAAASAAVVCARRGGRGGGDGAMDRAHPRARRRRHRGAHRRATPRVGRD